MAKLDQKEQEFYLPPNLQEVATSEHLFKPEIDEALDEKPTRSFKDLPRAVQVQRRKIVLRKALKLPPALHQFDFALDKEREHAIFDLLKNHAKENATERNDRLKRPQAYGNFSRVVTGLSKVTKLVERKNASIVLVAADTDPIELVVWLPALCRKMQVPYAIVKSRSKLGQLGRLKKCAVVAFPLLKEVKGMGNADKVKLEKLIKQCFEEFNEKPVRTWRLGTTENKNKDN